MGIIIHEIEHLKRSKTLGYLKYQILYRLNPKFRYREELECHKPQFKYYIKNNYSFNLKARAKTLSGRLYLWPVDFDTAQKDLRDLWDHYSNTEKGN